MMCQAVAGNGAENQLGYESPGALMGFELFRERVDPERVGRIAAEAAVKMLKAPVCPSGVMPVAIDNGFGGVIFHEACGHSLEATSVAFGTVSYTHLDVYKRQEIRLSSREIRLCSSIAA